MEPEEADLSAAVVRYWASFAGEFAPRGDVAWPAYEEETQKALVIGDLDGSVGSRTFEVAENLRSAKCDFWDDRFSIESAVTTLV